MTNVREDKDLFVATARNGAKIGKKAGRTFDRKMKQRAVENGERILFPDDHTSHSSFIAYVFFGKKVVVCRLFSRGIAGSLFSSAYAMHLSCTLNGHISC